MTEIVESGHIAGLKIARLTAFGDERGRFLETFRKDWFPERSWEIVQTNRSDSRAGVLRGLHYHFQQVDYWYVPRGRIRVGLADLIVDIVESGNTLKANGLVETRTILEIQAVLIANRAAYHLKRAAIDAVVGRLRRHLSASEAAALPAKK